MLQDIKRDFFDNGNIVTRLIIINVVIFVGVELTKTFFNLGSTGSGGGWFGQFVSDWFALNSQPGTVLTRPWTLITYVFLHGGIFHIFFNMLIFYWLGSLLADFIGYHRILPLFITGGISGGVLFLLAYNLLPLFSAGIGGLVGASAGVMAVLFGMATLRPDMQVRLILLGNVPLKYLALGLLVIDLISLSGGNGGGSFAHIGGAVFGYLYIRGLQNGRNLGYWLEWTLALFSKREKKADMKVQYKRPVKANYPGKPKPTETENRQANVDRILDKISQSGYESLSSEEKEYLFKYSKG